MDVEKLQFLYAYQKELLGERERVVGDNEDKRGIGKKQLNKRLVAINNKNGASQEMNNGAYSRTNIVVK